ncbi:hypothetical protein [Pedobacter frigoris]|uniref:hypothetical protein n=1 Tax=Pedobacter frigoris TaxID=2571272 RepID=UPI00292F0663|nr:hypothetical protein [Pedobacter frigoris]
MLSSFWLSMQMDVKNAPVQNTKNISGLFSQDCSYTPLLLAAGLERICYGFAAGLVRLNPLQIRLAPASNTLKISRGYKHNTTGLLADISRY